MFTHFTLCACKKHGRGSYTLASLSCILTARVLPHWPVATFCLCSYVSHNGGAPFSHYGYDNEAEEEWPCECRSTEQTSHSSQDLEYHITDFHRQHLLYSPQSLQLPHALNCLSWFAVSVPCWNDGLALMIVNLHMATVHCMYRVYVTFEQLFLK